MSTIQEPNDTQANNNKEINLFNLASPKTLLLYESANSNCLNEPTIKDSIKQDDTLNSLIQNVYVLYGEKSVLIVCKDENDLNRVDGLVKDVFDNLNRVELSESQLWLVTEINDSQLNQISDDKYKSIKTIEAKTGLKLKKIKKSIYFSGILYQFNLLNSMLSDAQTKLAKQEPETPKPAIIEEVKQQKIEIVDKPPPASPRERHDSTSGEPWFSLYSKSEIKSNFKIKPKHIDDKIVDSADVNVQNEIKNFEYDVYIFNADLTDLNTDALVNASNPNLHPGYNGDGISRRIREKAGKQMQDACKRILKQDHNCLVLNDSAVVYTKSYGKLKSKFVLHAIAPTWTKYVLNNNEDAGMLNDFLLCC